MIVAVLGNGPSRKVYETSTTSYDLIIGCNIPWTTVDETVILDEDIINLMMKNHDLIKVPIWFGKRAWHYLESCRKDRYFTHLFKGWIEHKDKYSSGHWAVIKAIESGATKIDVYGMDSYWEDTVESITHQIVPNTNADVKNITQWRENWKKVLDINPDIRVEFLKK